jgi:hypothetical protein
MFRSNIIKVVFLFLAIMAFSSGSIQAQNADTGPLSQEDIDRFISIYGSENPPAAAPASGLDYDRLSLVVGRLTSIYIAKGQIGDEQEQLVILSRGKVPVEQADYDLYQANDVALKPVMGKYLGTYTLRLAEAKADQSQWSESVAPVSETLVDKAAAEATVTETAVPVSTGTVSADIGQPETVSSQEAEQAAATDAPATQGVDGSQETGPAAGSPQDGGPEPLVQSAS